MRDPVHIALVHPVLRASGGIERHVLELARRLARRHQVTLVAAAVETAVPEGCAVLRVRWLRRPWFLRAASFSVASWWALRRRRFDVVHVHGAASLTGDVITAHSCHRAWFLGSLGALRPGSPRWWLKLFNPLHYFVMAVESIQYRIARPRRIIAVSGSVRDELGRGYDVAPERVAVVPNGVDASEFDRARQAGSRARVRARYGIGPDDVLLVFVGNEFRRKGLATLLAALARVRRPELRLLVVGRGDPGPYRRLCRGPALAGRVAFAGGIDEVAEFYAAADAFVLPTRYEAFSLAILEAMAAGLPVVTTGVAGARELIAHGESGLLLRDPDDAAELAALLRTLLDPATRRELGARARAVALRYSWDAMARATEEVYGGFGTLPETDLAGRSHRSARPQAHARVNP